MAKKGEERKRHPTGLFSYVYVTADDPGIWFYHDCLLLHDIKSPGLSHSIHYHEEDKCKKGSSIAVIGETEARLWGDDDHNRTILDIPFPFTK